MPVGLPDPYGTETSLPYQSSPRVHEFSRASATRKLEPGYAQVNSSGQADTYVDVPTVGRPRLLDSIEA